MKQILGILSVIIVLGAVVFVFFGHTAMKEKTKMSSEETKTTSEIVPSTTSEIQTKTTTTTAVD